MTEPAPQDKPLAEMSREELISTHFNNLVVQQANMALIFLGRVPHPETKERAVDLETARYFVDQLEMLEAKTKGNLSKDEEKLLKDGLTTVRMAFVQAAEEARPPGTQTPTTPAAPPAATEASTTPPPQAAPGPDIQPAAEAPAEDPESRKKFTKKY